MFSKIINTFIICFTLCGCSLINNALEEMQKNIDSNQQQINSMKKVTIIYNAKEIEAIAVTPAKYANKSPLIESIKKNYEIKTQNYTLQFNEKVKAEQEKSSINQYFAHELSKKIEQAGYQVTLVDKADVTNLNEYLAKTPKIDGVIKLNIMLGYTSPDNSFLFEPSTLINYEVYNKTAQRLSHGKVGGIGGWISDKYMTFNGLYEDADNARAKLKKYLMDNLDSTAQEILKVTVSNLN